ncbi:RepB family plasmid replication initiator protein [Enterococcus faecalis]|nr:MULTISPECIES: RepB family plasmid replication initiator protein [Bacteria]EFM77775.1 initiator RepB protein [Enterococcus faecalis TX2134]EGO7961120.1 RepB family plasmid replication initiator protein [Enterococcus faecalis]EGO8497450.1 RepB family plasmid replication initiator protein [Enterococcus faecalis]EGO8962261.1 RepB family plasmid replication initiator protein [Enterococcus faecalis]EHB5046424.1 RepB family plasmid replication initiator protein [Enterococcus faecalis]
MTSINEFSNQNKNQVVYLNEIEKRRVVEHNDLITSVAKMDKTPLKIFELAVSCIDTENPPKDNTVYLSKAELFTFFDVSDNGKHTRFKEAVEKMQKQAFFEIKQLKDNQKDFEMTSIVPIPTVKWNSWNDEVMIEFNRHIMPYLIDLKKNFTQYALSDVIELNSKYSIIIYKWLCMYYNQYEHYSAKGGRREEQVESYRNPSISIKELRILTDTVNTYKKLSMFEIRVLKEPLEEINEHTHFNVSYEKIKKGRSISSIQFHITKKPVVKNEFYKEEQQDPAYLADKAKKEEEKTILSGKAIQSPYTKLLVTQFIIGIEDLLDADLMAGLQQVVYPFYDELSSMRGIGEVERHINHIVKYQKEYSKHNVVKYLKESIEKYLITVKNQH